MFCTTCNCKTPCSWFLSIMYLSMSPKCYGSGPNVLHKCWYWTLPKTSYGCGPGICCIPVIKKEGNVLFNDTLNTFYLRLYDVKHMVKDHSSKRGNLLQTHGLLFPISSKGSFIYAPSHRQDNAYHDLCYTSHGALAEMRNSSMGPPWRIDLMTHWTMIEHSYHRATSHSCWYWTPPSPPP